MLFNVIWWSVKLNEKTVRPPNAKKMVDVYMGVALEPVSEMSGPDTRQIKPYVHGSMLATDAMAVADCVSSSCADVTVPSEISCDADVNAPSGDVTERCSLQTCAFEFVTSILSSAVEGRCGWSCGDGVMPSWIHCCCCCWCWWWWRLRDDVTASSESDSDLSLDWSLE